ncbi:MAG: sigma-70 family RNA polymerase sigma factor [Phycisphaerales bacterium]|nr:sigma-70 family RNA polymerase sigma factor [Phycisphaerales bacterium]MCB9854806.1 sigma-70 family RNA polymerase sigma factor [Phycisphaerales bacterium]MCB9863722.1 sigma-70 family RNA polymerase sigma factor [Phycisphaerales bacterium]
MNHEPPNQRPLPGPNDVTIVLANAGKGDASATEALFTIVYGALRTLAGKYLRSERGGHTLQPTALVHEAFLSLMRGETPDWRDRSHFFAVAARAMRRILINHAVARKALKRGGDRERTPLSIVVSPESPEPIDLLALDDALAKLADRDDRQAQIVELRFFGGLTNKEVAEVLGVSTRTVEGEWSMARAWLSRELREDSTIA